jgi:hypothetical protein
VHEIDHINIPQRGDDRTRISLFLWRLIFDWYQEHFNLLPLLGDHLYHGKDIVPALNSGIK